jgi:hypothetical protein
VRQSASEAHAAPFPVTTGLADPEAVAAVVLVLVLVLVLVAVALAVAVAVTVGAGGACTTAADADVAGTSAGGSFGGVLHAATARGARSSRASARFFMSVIGRYHAAKPARFDVL